MPPLLLRPLLTLLRAGLLCHFFCHCFRTSHDVRVAVCHLLPPAPCATRHAVAAAAARRRSHCSAARAAGTSACIESTNAQGAAPCTALACTAQARLGALDARPKDRTKFGTQRHRAHVNAA